jgi:hypothetical protein
MITGRVPERLVGLDECVKEVVGGTEDFGIESVQLGSLPTKAFVAGHSALHLGPFIRTDIVTAPIAILRDNEDGGRMQLTQVASAVLLAATGAAELEGAAKERAPLASKVLRPGNET